MVCIGTYLTDSKTSRWANARTEDGSQWVWIPRYAYKIEPTGTYTNDDNEVIDTYSSNPSEIPIIFLKGTTNTYEDDEGNIKSLPEGYIVHPAFTNEHDTEYANGGWDEEITGIWVAKYKAGYVKADEAVISDVRYECYLSYDVINNYTTNYYHNTTNDRIEVGTTKIYYPAFKPNLQMYQDIAIGDAYAICRELGEPGNPYGLTTANAHMIKNSEWGAVAYLAHSKYGRNGNEVSKNNCEYTGYGYANTKNNTYYYASENGKIASTTGNLYGIYDLSMDNSTVMGEFVSACTTKLTKNKSVIECFGRNIGVKEKSTKFVSVYQCWNSATTTYSKVLYEIYNKRKGDAFIEVSEPKRQSNGYYYLSSWFGSFVEIGTSGFIEREELFNTTESYGAPSYSTGTGSHSVSFRAVLI